MTAPQPPALPYTGRTTNGRTIGHPDDLALIDEYMRTMAVRAVADAIRAHQAILDQPCLDLVAQDWARVPAPRPPDINRTIPQTVTVRPVGQTDDELLYDRSWRPQHGQKVAIVGVIVTVIGVSAWLAWELLAVFDRATTAILCIILLLTLAVGAATKLFRR